MEETGFMLFGCGFLLFVVLLIIMMDREEYRRHINEAREFGYEGSRLKAKAEPKKKSFLKPFGP